MRALVGLLLGMMFSGGASAFELQAERVADNVYALVGPTDGRTYENLALNATFGFVVTPDAVVLIDAGASDAAAAVIEQAVRKVTDRPIRYVVNTGSQDHRWLGNHYFAAKGAEIVALQATVETQRRFADQHLEQLAPVLKDQLNDTQPVHADQPIKGDSHRWTVGSTELELRRFGDAHFNGDAVLWLSRQRVLFSGDLVYVDRVLGVLPSTDPVAWRDSFHAMATLKPAVIVPGHGAPCDLAKARRETGDYLDWLVNEVQAAAEAWEPLDEVVERLSGEERFAHLAHFDSLHRTNISRTYIRFEGN